MKTIHFLLIVIIIGIFIWGCSQTPPNEYQTNSSNIDTQNYWEGIDVIQNGQPVLEEIARELIKILNLRPVSDALEASLNSSPYINDIIDLNSFIFKSPLVLSELKKSMRKDENYLNSRLSLLPPKLDLYFYFKQHGIWKSGDPLLIAYPDSRIPEEQVQFIPAFNMKGEKLQLKPEGVPETPTLIITISEYDSDRPLKIDLNSEKVQDESYSLKKSLEQHCKISSEYVKVNNDHEPDYLEPPEFYIKMKPQQGYGDWRSTSITPPVNNTSPWTWHCLLYDLGTQGWPQYIMMELYEDDSGSGDDLVGKNWYTDVPPGDASLNLWGLGYLPWLTRSDWGVEATITLNCYLY
jgi:hypothetical protein